MPMVLCKPCSEADPATDKVKVDQELMKKRDEMEKKREEDAEAAAAAEAEEAEKRRQAEEKKRQEEAAEAERVRQQQKRDEEAARKKRQQEEEQAAINRAAAAKAEADEKEKQRLEALRLEQERKKADDKKKLEEWMKTKRAKDINAKVKTSLMSSKFPLHIAVEENNADIVRILKESGADLAVVSSKLTPLRLAEKLAQKAPAGTYDAVLAQLR